MKKARSEKLNRERGNPSFWSIELSKLSGSQGKSAVREEKMAIWVSIDNIGSWIQGRYWELDTGTILGAGYRDDIGSWIQGRYWKQDTGTILGAGYRDDIGSRIRGRYWEQDTGTILGAGYRDDIVSWV